MKFLSDILAKAGLTVDGVVTLNNTATGQTPNANDNSTKLATTAWVRTFVQPYSLPIASASVLGGVKVGSGLSINSTTGVLSVTGASAASIKSTQTFVVTQGQTVFTVTGGYTPGLIDIFLNGVYLSPNQTVATNGTTFTINDPAAAGDIVDVIVASAIFEGSASTTDQLPEGSINLYYTNTRARAAITLTTTGVSGAATYNSSTGVFNIPNYQGLVPAGGVAGDILAKVSGTNYDVTWIPNYTSQVQHIVKAAVAVTKGQAVYVSSADGTNMIVSKASNASEQTSSKTLGLVAQDLAINGQGFVVTEGLLAGLDTSTATAGDPVWLGTNGNLIFGLLNKPTAPAHLVFIGVVTRVQQNNGEIFVKVQNGFEFGELHDYVQSGVQNNFVISYESSTGLYKPKSIATLLGYTPTDSARTLTINGTAFDLSANRSWSVGTVTSVAALTIGNTGTDITSTVANSTTTPVITLNVPDASAFARGVITTGTQTIAGGKYFSDNVAIGHTSPFDVSQFSLDINGGLLVKNSSKTAQFVLINSNPALGGNNAFVVHTVGGSSGTSYADIQGYYGTSITGSTVLRLNPQGGNVLIGNLAGTGTRMVVASATGVLSTQAIQTLSDLSGVPTARTLTINGLTFDLSANRSWTINSMVYPSAGIAVSTGTAWGTSITDNSSNWNTAFSWGNHASAGYATTTYVNTQVANLVASAPAALDTLNELATALGNDAAFSTTVTTALGNRLRIDTASQGLTSTQQGYGRTNLGLGSLATLSSINNSYITDLAYSKLTGVPTSFTPSTHTHVWADITDRPTNLSAFTNGPGYLTGITSSQVTTALGYTPYNSTNPSGYITSAALSSYLPLSGGTLTGTLTISTTEDGKLILRAPSGDTSQWNYINFVGTDGVRDAYFGTDGSGNPQWWRDDNSLRITLGSVATINDVQIVTNSGTWAINVSGTAGSISGFNNPTTGATANTIAYRDSGGDLYARYMFAVHFNQSGGNSENPTIGQIWTQNTTDNYVRKSTPAHFISQLGLVTGGPYLPLAGGTMSGKLFTVSTGTGTYDSAIEIRETGYASNGQSAWGYSPAITFHWGNRYAKRFGMRSDGLFAVDDEPLALRSWVTSQGYVTGGPYLPTAGGTLTGNLNISPGGSIDNYFTASGANAWRFIYASAANPEGFGVGAQGFGIYRNGLSNYHLMFNTVGDVTAPYSMRAPIFYDSNDTSFYLDPNGSSVLNGTVVIKGNDNQLAIDGTSGYQAAGIFFREGGNNRWELYNYNGNFRFYNYTTGSEELTINNSAGFVTARTSFRAPIFYDSSDTAYYLDPNSDSNLWKFTFGTMSRNGMNPLSVNSPWSTRASQASPYQNGTMGWGQNDLNSIGSYWGSGFIDSWSSPGNAPGGSSHYVGMQGMHYNDQNGNFHGWQMVCAQESTNRWFWRSSWNIPNRPWVEMIHSGNIGSQSVSYASSAGSASNATTLAGIGISTIRGGISSNNFDFYVNGDANTYYPVVLSLGGQYGMHRYSISRGYSDPAPWDPIGTGSHRGGLTLTFDASSDIAWGGNDKSWRIIQFAEQYTNMVAGMALPVTDGIIVWLRGGGAYYRFHGPSGINHGATVYYSGYTAANGAFYAVRTNLNSVDSEIRAKWPIRGYGDGDMYVSNQTVIHTGNVGSQSVSYASNSGSLGGYSSGTYLGKFGNGNGYYQSDNWIQVNGSHGIFWPSYYSLHIRPNISSTYTQMEIIGSKNSYGGIYDNHSAVNGMMYDGGGNGGVYREANGRWYWYYHVGNACMGINTSTTSSSYAAYVNGNLYATGDITAYSDRRKKTDIITIDNALDKVTKLRGVYYNKIDDLEKGRQTGVIAQEINEVLPEVVTYAADIDEYGVKYGNIAGVLIEAIKEQQTQIESQKSEIKELKDLVKQLINR